MSEQRETFTGWLITGGCGFIGKSLIRSLIKRQKSVAIRVLDNLSVGSREDLASVCNYTEIELSQLESSDLKTGKLHVELVVGDIRDKNIAVDCCKGIDVVVHLAANTGVDPSVADPRLDMECNVGGTFNLLEGTRINGVRRFVFASSGAPVGEVEPPIHEGVAARPVSPYGASKLAGEGYCSAYFRTFGVETVALRFGNVYGPGSNHKSSVVAKFVRRAIRGENLEIYGDGKQTRDFIYIEDLVRAIELASQVPKIGGEIFQIANSSETTILELVDELLHALSIFGIHDTNVVHKETRLGDVRRNFSDTSKARRLLNWQAKVALADGLRTTIEWFMNR